MKFHSPRHDRLLALFPEAPTFRFVQAEKALFDRAITSVESISTLPEAWRTALVADPEYRWFAAAESFVQGSKKKDTFKALLTLQDEKKIETVLMQNSRGHWSVCVSSQIGCAMACTFCATGKMGLTRNLTVDEIIDQYRFWEQFLAARPELPQYISNLVFMGMGEPLANYANVKEVLRLLLTYTDMGPTRITVSTVGLVPMLEYLLNDESWPAVRLAVSLHSADTESRKKMMPTSYDDFLEKLLVWTKKYFEKFESRRRHLTFEYVMLSKVNDTEMHAKKLVKFARQVGKVRINLIPYNFTGEIYTDSLPGDFQKFESILRAAGVDVTKRRTMGEDIDAACGQLANITNTKSEIV
jgi:23S rRNA (adenine2503-C2)-methyltransferase